MLVPLGTTDLQGSAESFYRMCLQARCLASAEPTAVEPTFLTEIKEMKPSMHVVYTSNGQLKVAQLNFFCVSRRTSSLGRVV